ncbi:hypothetical protein PG996_008155 [Apiospora saccharicola]|uniref:Uncharacterized protein n=1 Tax=Apiospora saccharicola TaxID=335842 RepID=A0ABR1UX40_9PEZI
MDMWKSWRWTVLQCTQQSNGISRGFIRGESQRLELLVVFANTASLPCSTPRWVVEMGYSAPIVASTTFSD